MMQKYVTPILLLIVAARFSGCITDRPNGHRRLNNVHNGGKSEVSLSYGRYSGTQLGYDLPRADVYPYPVQTFTSGNIFATYEYYLTNGLCINFTIGEQALRYDWFNASYYSYGNPPGAFRYHDNLNVITTAIELKKLYIYTPHFQFYGFLGLGCSYHSESFSDIVYIDNDVPFNGTNFNLQITPLGFRFGKNIGGYLELGIGYKGLVNTGVFYAFR